MLIFLKLVLVCQSLFVFKVNLLIQLLGTGGTTGHLLEALKNKFSYYVFTDVSNAFLEKAKVKFSKYSNKMNFCLLDIETDPTAQGTQNLSIFIVTHQHSGFRENNYDIIVAFNVIHATADINP